MNTTATNPSDNNMSTDTQLRWDFENTMTSSSQQGYKVGRILLGTDWIAFEPTYPPLVQIGRFPTREAAKEACERHHQSQLSA